jgi:2-amino-4-hydroxy-6-hydroxymethyldihydropteridine diphosphokinase
MARVYLSLGSNVGDRRQYLDEALRHLAEHTAVRVVVCSTLYEAEPWPEERVTRERWYLNCAVEIETELSPHHLLGLLQAIEADAGRGVAPPPVPAPASPLAAAPRTLDIDILLYGDQVLSDNDLQVPHLLLHERRFVLTSLAEIAPDVEHPTLYRSIRELLAETDDQRGIFPYR